MEYFSFFLPNCQCQHPLWQAPSLPPLIKEEKTLKKRKKKKRQKPELLLPLIEWSNHQRWQVRIGGQVIYMLLWSRWIPVLVVNETCIFLSPPPLQEGKTLSSYLTNARTKEISLPLPFCPFKQLLFIFQALKGQCGFPIVFPFPWVMVTVKFWIPWIRHEDIKYRRV